MTISGRNDLELAYKQIRWMEQVLADLGCADEIGANEYVIDMKRKVRKYTHREPPYERVIEVAWDEFIELYPLPEYLESLDDAEQYFEEWERIERPHSMYDCTGKAFTSGHKIFMRRGRFYVYHFISYDV